MPWQCKLVEEAKRPRKPGDMWFAPWVLERKITKDMLSPEYLKDWADKRPPIMVELPEGGYFCPDFKAHDKDRGWTVTGEAPNITVMPSVNRICSPRGYHGWIKDGVLTDDLEGRKY